MLGCFYTELCKKGTVFFVDNLFESWSQGCKFTECIRPKIFELPFTAINPIPSKYISVVFQSHCIKAHVSYLNFIVVWQSLHFDRPVICFPEFHKECEHGHWYIVR